MFTKIKKSLEKFIAAVVMMVLNLVGKPLDLKKSSGNSRTGKTNSRASNKPQIHWSNKDTIMVRGSRNSFQCFALPLFNFAPTELILHKTEAIPKRSDRMQLFFRPDLFMMTTLVNHPYVCDEETEHDPENIFILTLLESSGKIKRKGRKARIIVKKIKAALHWPRINTDKLVKGRHIEDMLTGNSNFPVPWPSNIVTLANLGSHLDDFEDALAVKDADLIASTGVIVQDDLKNIMTMVQIKMDSNRPLAEKICSGAGYDVGKEIPHSTRKNSVKAGSEPGSAILTGVGKGTHEWELSYDGGLTSKPLRATTKGRKELTGEKPDIEIWQRNCQVFPNDTYGEWTDWVSGRTGK